MKVKVHLVIPKEIMPEVDPIAGKRGRCRSIAETAHEKLERERFVNLLEPTKSWLCRLPDLQPPPAFGDAFGRQTKVLAMLVYLRLIAIEIAITLLITDREMHFRR